MTVTYDPPPAADAGPLSMIWVELGQECQLECTHCYLGAGPGLGWGTMTPENWEQVLLEAAESRARHVTFIGGEPTLYPHLGRLVTHALGLGLRAEVFSNLVHVTAAQWDLFSLPGVSLAFSWYTGSREQHAEITGRDTWRQTRAGIAEAVRRGIDVRAGVIDGIIAGQDTEGGVRVLESLGVTRIGRDAIREFGRGTIPDPSQSCGSCGRGRAAVLSDGSVTPCPMTRWLVAGNARDASLAAALEALPAVTAGLPGRAAPCRPDIDCRPDVDCRPLDRVESSARDCMPDHYCNPNCSPGACKPRI
jgi:MoaA/NifB/PqqE/SkfB family radical SAM enzyme